MRVLAPIFGILASIVTIFAAVVRLWWAKPKFRGTVHYTNPGVQEEVLEPKGPSWVRTAAKWWLIVLFFGGLVIGLVIVVLTLIDLST